jgi:hypothetical protein
MAGRARAGILLGVALVGIGYADGAGREHEVPAPPVTATVIPAALAGIVPPLPLAPSPAARLMPVPAPLVAASLVGEEVLPLVLEAGSEFGTLGDQAALPICFDAASLGRHGLALVPLQRAVQDLRLLGAEPVTKVVAASYSRHVDLALPHCAEPATGLVTLGDAALWMPPPDGHAPASAARTIPYHPLATGSGPRMRAFAGLPSSGGGSTGGGGGGSADDGFSLRPPLPGDQGPPAVTPVPPAVLTIASGLAFLAVLRRRHRLRDARQPACASADDLAD